MCGESQGLYGLEGATKFQFKKIFLPKIATKSLKFIVQVWVENGAYFIF